MYSGLRLKQVPLVTRSNFGLSGSKISLGELSLTDATFSQALSAPKAVVYFGSPACHYCQDYKPIFKEVSDQYGSNLLMAAVDVSDAPEATKTYGIKGLPATIFFISGKEVGRVEGSMEKGDLEAEIRKALGTIAAPGPVQTTVPESPIDGLQPSDSPLTEASPMPKLPQGTVSKSQPAPFPVLPVLGGAAVVGLAIWYFASRSR